MDAHVFRRICDALSPFLTGARLEKIQSPAAHVHVFSWYAQQRRQHLVLRAGRQAPFLYMASERPVCGTAPSAAVMRLRKYCAGRRVAACLADWTARRLSLLFQAPAESTGAPLPPETWLTLDLREGPLLLLGKSPHSFSDPLWPDAHTLADACADWRAWPVLTPALRRTLPLLEPLDQAALLADLQAGGGDLFVYECPDAADVAETDVAEAEGALPAQCPAAASVPVPGAVQSPPAAPSVHPVPSVPEIFAWPLPAALRGQRTEQVLEDPLEAAALLGGERVLGAAADKMRAEAAAPWRREAERLARLLQKLETEETRLRGMVEAQAQGMALQAVLWRYGPDERLPFVETEDARHGRVELNPRLTVRENMQALFHQAARGRRGLAFVEERRRTLQEQAQALRCTAEAAALGAPLAPALPGAGGAGQGGKAARRGLQVGDRENRGNRGSAGESPQGGGNPQNRWPKGVQAFRSSDGFIILRGRDARGNWALLRVAAGHDLWLHVDGGPGSHALIRRAFAGQEIPERTLHEAAALAAAKSWQKDSPDALILCAQARHVKPLRGAAPGTVRVDKVARTFRVEACPELEATLAI